MVRYLLIFIFAINIMPAAAADLPPPSFLALCYHNVEDQDPDQTYEGVTTARLVEHLSWLQSNGYHFVSVDDLIAAKDGHKPLPDKAVLLTFDDGYVSFYTRVFPVLKAFHAPAVLGLVGSWMGNGVNGEVSYGDETLSRKAFVTWDQVREMFRSGLVEIAAHSNAQHHNILANPQGNTEPAMVTRRFDPVTASYESGEAYEKRIKADTAAISRIIAHEIGKRPRVMIWPYGETNDFAVSIATADGMPITFTLQDGVATLDRIRASPRYLVEDNPSIGDFVGAIDKIPAVHTIRVVQVDLDTVYDPDPAQQGRNLDALIERIYRLQINAVFLQAFSDPDKPGFAKQLYFPNRYLPMRADLFNHVSWQLRTRAKVQVFAWMPLLAFDFGDTDSDAQHRKILGLYEDLARAAPFDGLFFDDAPSSEEAAHLPDFIQALVAHVRHYRAPLMTARTIASPINKEQLDSFLKTYDYTVIQANGDEPWLRQMVKTIAARPDGLQHTIFDLPTVDGQEGTIPTETIAGQMRFLARAGALNFGYYPDDVAGNHPDASELHKDFSLQSYPYLP